MFNTSSEENEISEYIEGLIDDNIILNDRYTISPNELDIYVPSRNVAFEYDGLYWHSDKFVSKDYHLSKTEKAITKGIKLIHIFEDEWLYKKDIVKSMINKELGCSKIIDASNCDVKIIKNNVTETFINNNSIHYYVPCDFNIGLYYRDELLSTISFKNDKVNGHYLLQNFCDKKYFTVRKGIIKLINEFINMMKPKEIITYIDRRWDNSDVFYEIGFKHIESLAPTCHYIINNKRTTEINNNPNSKRLYDCGSLLLSLRIKGEVNE